MEFNNVLFFLGCLDIADSIPYRIKPINTKAAYNNNNDIPLCLIGHFCTVFKYWIYILFWCINRLAFGFVSIEVLSRRILIDKPKYATK